MRPLRTRSRKVGRGRIIMAISKSPRADIDQGQFTVANSHRGCGISAVCGLPMRTNQMSRIYLGHNVYGLAAVIFGVITLAWRDLNAWREIMPFGKVTHPEILLYSAAAIELFGGFAIQWPRTKRIGAFSLGSIYFIFALFSVRKRSEEHTSELQSRGHLVCRLL